MFNAKDTIELDERSRIGDIEMINEIFEWKSKLDKRVISSEEFIQRKQRIMDRCTSTYDKNFVYIEEYNEPEEEKRGRDNDDEVYIPGDDSSEEFDRILGNLTEDLDVELEKKRKEDRKHIDLSILLEDMAICEEASKKNIIAQRFYTKPAKILLEAVRRGDEEIVRKLLVEKNLPANVLEKTHYETVLHLACKSKNEKMVNVLLQNGASVNIPDRKGKTSFHIACEYSLSKDTIEHMIRCGANHQMSDNLGFHPLDYIENDNIANSYLEYISEFHKENGDIDEYLEDLGTPIKYHIKKKATVYLKSGNRTVVEVDSATTIPELVFLACNNLNMSQYSDSLMIIEQVDQQKFISLPENLNIIKRMKTWSQNSLNRFVMLPKKGCDISVTTAYQKLCLN